MECNLLYQPCACDTVCECRAPGKFTGISTVKLQNTKEICSEIFYGMTKSHKQTRCLWIQLSLNIFHRDPTCQQRHRLLIAAQSLLHCQGPIQELVSPIFMSPWDVQAPSKARPSTEIIIDWLLRHMLWTWVESLKDVQSGTSSLMPWL